MKKIVVVRFSALGDVAMTVPVIYSMATAYPEIQITILSREAFRPLFQKLPANVNFISADLKGKHQGIRGIFRLFRELHQMKFDGFADLHNVLRTKLLRVCFAFTKTRTAFIDKGRDEKKALTRKHHKEFKPLKNSFERYHDVFKKLGYSFPLNFTSLFPGNIEFPENLQRVTGEKLPDTKWIGIAPFAKHPGKILPLKKWEEVIETLSKNSAYKIFLFGGGKTEEDILNTWAQKYPSVVSLPGKLNMEQEILLMHFLDVMVSMDSANMHLASLAGTPVISIWGATHPWCGFMGWSQSENNTIQRDLPCRPCSVFGNKPCYREDYACLNEVTSSEIIQKILDFNYLAWSPRFSVSLFKEL